MLSIVLLGTGNVATHLFQAFQNAPNIEIVEVFGRDATALDYFARYTKVSTTIDAIKNADIYVIAVSDDAITQVSQSLTQKEGLIAHTSGSVSLSGLQTKRKGVFYPLQSFTKEKEVNFSEVPICIEAESKEDLDVLLSLGKSISNQVHPVSSQQRKKLHLSAVIVNNFSNHLFHWANEICEENAIPFHLLQPLISETVDKMRHLSPFDAQTGPARRNDLVTMQGHIEQLQYPLQKKIYQLMSESIKTLYEKEL